MKPISIPYTMEDVRERESRSLFTVFSTFAGGGGSSTGYRLAGGNILGINEFIPAAIETYLANYPETTVFRQDIRKLTGRKICSKLNILPGELDILDGSPPCASFSMSGSRDKMWGKVKKYSDTSQRVDDLFFEFSRLLKQLMPKIFITENVKGLTIGIARTVLGKKRSTSLNIPDVIDQPTILDELKKCGYNVDYKVLNSADYGVPQTRERIFIVGIRKDLKMKPVFPRRNVLRWVSVKEAFQNVPVIDEENYIFKPESETSKLQLKCKQGQSASEVHPKGHYFNWGRLSEDLPHPTLLQASGGKYFLHYNESRYITLAEGKRVQGFPDDFILTGSLKQKWERLGRSVPPPMLAAIVSNLYEEVLKNVRNSRRI